MAVLVEDVDEHHQMVRARGGDIVYEPVDQPVPGLRCAPDLALSVDELRAVTAFNLARARRVIDIVASVRAHGRRPREALAAAAHFVGGGARSKAQRVSALGRAVAEVMSALDRRRRAGATR